MKVQGTRKKELARKGPNKEQLGRKGKLKESNGTKEEELEKKALTERKLELAKTGASTKYDTRGQKRINERKIYTKINKL
jgi:hypothetical protein